MIRASSGLVLLFFLGCLPPFPDFSGPADRDAGLVDAGGGLDAGVDAGADAGADAGVDAGVDAGPPPPPAVLLASFSFDEGVGARVADAVGLIAGELVGPVAFADDVVVSGSALRFTGADARVELPSDHFDSVTEGSLGAWFLWEGGASATGTVFGTDTGGCERWSLVIEEGRVAVFASDAQCSDTLIARGPSITPGTWHHVVYGASERDGHRLYLDGVVATLEYAVGDESLGPFLGGAPGSTRAQIGARLGAVSDSFIGRIDEVRVYDARLTLDEVTTDAALRLTPFPDRTLRAGFAFSEPGAVYPDLAGQMTGTVDGTVPWIASGRHGGAVEFNAGAGFIEVGPPDHLDDLSVGTVSFWFRKPNSDSADGIQIAFAADHAGCDDLLGWGTVGEQITLRSSIPGTCSGDHVADMPLPDPATWTHFAYVQSSTGNVFYVDGALADAAYSSGDADASHFFSHAGSNETHYTIGQTPFTTSMIFTGEVDEVRVYEEPLSDVEILLDMAAHFD